MHTLIITVAGDVYEVIYSSTEVLDIVRYRNGVRSTGEQVAFEWLDPRTQNAIYQRLKSALATEDET